MSALRLINETSATSVSSISVTDVFTSDFDIYKIVINELDMANNGRSIYLRPINSSGTIVTSSINDYAFLYLKSNTTFAENRATSSSLFAPIMANVGSNSAYAGGSVVWFFNPFSNTSYTFTIGQSSDVESAGNYQGQKSISVHKSTTSITGFSVLQDIADTFDNITIKTYGLRVDNG